MYFNSEVILAGLLNYYPNSAFGVDSMLIERYCKNIKKILSEHMNQEYIIFFQNNIHDIDNDIYLFPKQFKKFMGRYFKGENFDFSFFENRCYSVFFLNEILLDAAIDLME